MTIVTNKNVRFAENNFAELISASIEYSSQLSAFPFSNCINRFRSKLWKPSGNFTITDLNNKIYINDGANKTITLTNGNYSTPVLLASHIQTQLNSTSSNWVVSYVTGTYKFSITHTGNATLRFSQTTNSTWDTLGYLGTSDVVGTSFLADDQRNHTSEYCIFDMGYQADITFFAVIGPLQYIFPISTTATITLKANNLNQWDTVPLSITLDRSDAGIFKFLDDVIDSRFRFWRFEYEDRRNPNGPEGTSIGHIYIGDYLTLANRNIEVGFNKHLIDPSETKESENGAVYFDRRTKYGTFSNLTLQYLERADKDMLEDLFNRLGIYTPFYISLDPTLSISDTYGEFTKYVTFSTAPDFTHIIFDKFNMQMDFREQV
jgi:hypothetical protein